MELIKNLKDVRSYINKRQNFKNNMINKAIDASYEMLKLDDFIRTVEFPMPDIMELSTIRQFKADIPVLINKSLILSFGYSGEYRNQKVALLKLINSHNLPYTQLTNKEYDEFACFNIEAPSSTDVDPIQEYYPKLKNQNGKSTHILMLPRDLNKLMMVVNTEKGDIMREYCQTLTELFDLYLEYQNEYKATQLLIKDKKIDEMLIMLQKNKISMDEYKISMDEYKISMDKSKISLDENKILIKDSNRTIYELQDKVEDFSDKLELAVEDRVPKTINSKLLEKFVLLRLHSTDPNEPDYYVIRAQSRNVAAAIKKIKAMYTNAKRSITIEYQPNSKNLFNRIKEQLTEYVNVDGNYMSLIGDTTHRELIYEINKLNEDKKEFD